ncbi:hypothetical protein GCM10027421_35450 [Microbacterium shaanxiense]
MAEKAAAVKSGEVKAAAAKTAAARTTAAKTAAAKSAAARSAATRTATKTAAAKAAAAKTTAAKSAAAKSAAAKAAAAKAAEAKAAEADAAGSGQATDADEQAQPKTETPAATAPAAPVRTPAAKRPAPKKTARTTKPRATSAATRPKPVVAADAAAPTAETVASPEPAAPRPAEDAGAEDVLFADLLSSEPAHADAAAESADATPSATEPAAEESASSEPPVVEPEIVEPEVVVPEDVVPEVVEPEDATPAAAAETLAGPASAEHAVILRDLVKDFGDQRAVNGIDLTVPAGSFYGIVGPNGAGKTTTLSILAGLLRATSGQVVVCGIDQAEDSLGAKRLMGVLPDRLRTFDRLTGRQLLHYYGLLRGLAADVIDKRTADLARAFDLADALNRVVSDYSAGMTKKIMLAGAMIHSPRVLVLDEPFEAVDPVSSAVILDILRAYVAHGGTVILSSHGMDLVERVCSRVAIIVGGDVLAEGTIDEVRAGSTLEARFVELSGGISEVEGLEWLHTFSD